VIPPTASMRVTAGGPMTLLVASSAGYLSSSVWRWHELSCLMVSKPLNRPSGSSPVGGAPGLRQCTLPGPEEGRGVVGYSSTLSGAPLSLVLSHSPAHPLAHRQKNEGLPQRTNPAWRNPQTLPKGGL